MSHWAACANRPVHILRDISDVANLGNRAIRHGGDANTRVGLSSLQEYKMSVCSGLLLVQMKRTDVWVCTGRRLSNNQALNKAEDPKV